MLYVGLGSNLGDRSQNLHRALDLLNGRIGRLVATSDFYETEPVGFCSPHFFLNAAAAFETSLSAQRLLRETQAVEREMGRVLKSIDGHYSDRVIDIDLLWLDGCFVTSPNLTLPHPSLTTRRFVLQPLSDIAPDLRILGRTVNEWLNSLSL